MTTIAGLLAVALVTVRGQKADRQIVPIPPPTIHTHTHTHTHTDTHNIWLSVICACSLSVLETGKDQIGLSGVRCVTCLI